MYSQRSSKLSNNLKSEKSKPKTSSSKCDLPFMPEQVSPSRKGRKKIDPNFTTTYVVKYFASDFSDLGYFI